MHYFVTSMEEYIMVEVIELSWSILRKKLQTINMFEELVALHNDYLDVIMEKCFIAKAEKSGLLLTLNQMFGFILKFHQLVKEFGPAIVSDYQAKIEVKSISAQFAEYSLFLYKVVKKLAY